MNELHRLEDYLATHHVPYEVISYPHTATSLQTARAAQVDARRLAKAVLLEGDGCLLAALLPADQRVSLGRLSQDFGEHIHLADEATMRTLFADCEPGAMPGLPKAWGIDMVWDDELLAQADLYLETGDHMRLVHVETRHLKEILADTPHCHFSILKRFH